MLEYNLYKSLLYLFYTLGKERPQMKDLENHVTTGYDPHWIQLGKQLNIDQCLLNIIQHDHGRDCVECCSRMLDTWLQENTHNNATWDILINAIDRLPNDLHDLSKKQCIFYLLHSHTIKSFLVLHVASYVYVTKWI